MLRIDTPQQHHVRDEQQRERDAQIRAVRELRAFGPRLVEPGLLVPAVLCAPGADRVLALIHSIARLALTALGVVARAIRRIHSALCCATGSVFSVTLQSFSAGNGRFCGERRG